MIFRRESFMRHYVTSVMHDIDICCAAVMRVRATTQYAMHHHAGTTHHGVAQRRADVAYAFSRVPPACDTRDAPERDILCRLPILPFFFCAWSSRATPRHNRYEDYRVTLVLMPPGYYRRFACERPVTRWPGQSI